MRVVATMFACVYFKLCHREELIKHRSPQLHSPPCGHSGGAPRPTGRPALRNACKMQSKPLRLLYYCRRVETEINTSWFERTAKTTTTLCGQASLQVVRTLFHSKNETRDLAVTPLPSQPSPAHLPFESLGCSSVGGIRCRHIDHAVHFARPHAVVVSPDRMSVQSCRRYHIVTRTVQLLPHDLDGNDIVLTAMTM